MGAKYAFFLLLLINFVFSVNINSCQNLSTQGETYVLQNDIPAASARCINITANDTTLNCDGHSILGPGTGTVGIGVYTNASNTTIMDCTIAYYDIGIYSNGTNLSPIITHILNVTLYNQSVGIQANDAVLNVSDTTLHNQTVGVYAGGTYSWPLIQNSMLYNQIIGIYVQSNYSWPLIQNSMLYNQIIGIDVGNGPRAVWGPQVTNTTLYNQALGINVGNGVYIWDVNITNATLYNQAIGIYLGNAYMWDTNIDDVTLYNQTTGIQIANYTWYANISNVVLYNQTTGINISDSWFINIENITLYNHTGPSAAFGPLWYMNITNYEAYNSESNALYIMAWYLNLTDIYVHDSGGGTYILGGYFNLTGHRSINISEDLYTAVPQYSPGIGLYVESGTGVCDISDVYSYNTSSSAVSLYDVFNCTLSDVYAEYGAYNGQTDSLISMHGDQSYLDPCPNSNAWNITAVRSYANLSNISGGIGIAVTNGMVENITAHDCKMSGVGVVLGNNSVARNLEGYNNGLAGVAVVAGLQNISMLDIYGDPFPLMPVVWDKSDEGPAEAYNLTGYNNGYIGVAAAVINKSLISGIEAYNTGPNYWGLEVDELCDPLASNCMPFSYFYLDEGAGPLNSTTARIGALLFGYDTNNAWSFPANTSQTGTIEDVHAYNNSIGVMPYSVMGAFIEDVSSYDNSQHGVYPQEVMRASLNNISSHDNGRDGLNTYSDMAFILAGAELLLNNSEFYDNGQDGIGNPDISVALDIHNSEIHDNGGRGMHLPWDWLGSYTNLLVYDNGMEGFYSYYISEDNITNCSFYNNGGDGFHASMIEIASIRESSFYGNAGHGFGTMSSWWFNMSNTSSYGNGGDGFNFCVDDVSLFGDFCLHEGVLLNHTDAYSNAGDGIAIQDIIVPRSNASHGRTPVPTLLNSELYENEGAGLVVSTGVNWIYNTTISSNEIGVKMLPPLTNTTVTMDLSTSPEPPHISRPYPNTTFIMNDSLLMRNKQADFMIDIPVMGNFTPNISVTVFNTTFWRTPVSLFYTTNNSDPIDISFSGSNSLPQRPPPTYAPLFRTLDVESPTGENLNATLIHYTDDDIIGRNVSNLEVFVYHDNKWSKVQDQVHWDAWKFFVFYNYSNFSTFTIFENSTDYGTDEDDDHECTRDKDCDPCYICKWHSCRLPDEACPDNSYCPPEYTCVDCECVPPECFIDSDCPEGYECEDYECVPPECMEDSDCPSGYTCEDYECVPPECMEDSDCPTGYECENYECVPPECMEDSDCPEGYECENYGCIKEPEEIAPELELQIEVSESPVEGSEVTIIITDQDGNAVAGAEALIQFKEGIKTITYGPVLTDSDGEVSFTPDTSGEHTAYAAKEGYPDAQEQFMVSAAPAPPAVGAGVPAAEAPQQFIEEDALQWLMMALLFIMVIAMMVYMFLSRRRKGKKKG